MIAFACLFLAQLGPLPFERDVVQTDKGALMMLPPRHVAGPSVAEFSWSKDGRYLYAIAFDGGDEVARMGSSLDVPRQAAGKNSLSVYDTKGNKATVVLDSDKVVISSAEWMAGSTLVIQTSQVIPSGPNRPGPALLQRILRWQPGTSAPTEVLAYEPKEEQLECVLSASLPYGLAFLMPLGQAGAKAWVFGDRGVAKEIQVPTGYPMTDANGKLCIMHNRTDVPFEGPDKPKRSYYRVEPNGSVTELSGRPTFYSHNAKMDVLSPAQTKASATLNRELVIKHNQTWLIAHKGGNANEALVAAESENAQVASDGNHIAYVTQSNLLVREIRQLSADEYEKMRDLAERELMMSRAKQVAMAAMIYASDNDDKAPPKNGFIDALTPYTKDSSFFQGFSYEMNGESLTEVKDPSKTVMGYIQGRNGRAIAYADGSVRWMPNR